MGSKGSAMNDKDKKNSLNSIINQVVKNKVQAEAKRQEKANQSSQDKFDVKKAKDDKKKTKKEAGKGLSKT